MICFVTGRWEFFSSEILCEVSLLKLKYSKNRFKYHKVSENAFYLVWVFEVTLSDFLL